MWDDAGARWSAFHAALKWRPIAEYDRDDETVVLLREAEGQSEAIGYWHDGDWWHAQESLDDQKLNFPPQEFAEVDDEWRTHLMAD